MIKYSYCLIILLFISCKESENPRDRNLYFPPLAGSIWETQSPSSLDWNENELEALYKLLETGNTRGFIVLKDGKIAIEKYFGPQLLGNQPFGQSSVWYWASAGKTLTATLAGIAQQEGLLNIHAPTSTYLGNGWTSTSPSQENAITVWHQLTMTTGLDDGVSNRDNTNPESLKYFAAPGTRWAYHNAPYTLLECVISNATNRSFSDYFDTKIASKIGMVGSWQTIDFNNVYFSNTRSMARFGLLILAKGKWGNQEVLNDHAFFEQMVNTSQTLNPAYGYLWWLNGKTPFMIPSIQLQFNGILIPDAPHDMIIAAGRDGQFVCLVPSQNLVLIRTGLDSNNALVSFTYLNQIWTALNRVIK
ncbi:serine hydrolase domain-containing protein [Mongoliitalea daihaiensis]|uniref:serine hydrolase domain-containing protein n=1 Tax=Mongoliitalea daihaiensis TaxID=2782006 RepID=UPI001F375B2D|nr:serine hydrolase domain-containing protein [Mongoliitalea daihaiensis]UJP64616.1 beta-lactamase family protein [Mongoliitalea daihaiensis]